MTFGFGFYDGPVGLSINNVIYNWWSCMIERCYSEKYHEKQPTYKDVEICDEWKYYSNFEKWTLENMVDGYQLDKDLLSNGCKIYSPDTCCFLPRILNITISSNNKNKNYLYGVSQNRNIYRSRIRKYSKLVNLGSYKTQEEAHRVWQKEKALYLRELLGEYKKHLKPIVVDKIIFLIEKIENDCSNGIITTSILPINQI